MAVDLNTVIVSVYGRGDWLATELKSSGVPVTLIDLTELMGPWSPEDIEGPFGIFRSRKNSGSQMARLEDEDPLLSNDRGWILWTRDHILELKGPLASLQLAKFDFDSQSLDYVRSADAAKPQDFTLQRKKVGGLSFERSWIAHLAHQYSSSVFKQNSDALSFGRPSPLSSPFFFRRLTRRGRTHAKQNLIDGGVRVVEPTGVNGLHTSGGLVEGVSLEGDINVVGGSNFVWMLTSEETERINQKTVGKALFPKGKVASEWYWTRYRIRINDSKYSGQLPSHFVCIEDPYLPWGHDNLCLIQRTAKDEDFDFWVRLPTGQRFLIDYVKDFGSRVLDNFKNRLPNVSAQIIDWPQEVEYGPDVLGPPIHPVFDLEDRLSLERANLKNMFFDGPEVALSLAWSGQFRSNEKTLGVLKERIEIQKQKDNRSHRDLTVHPS